MAMNNCEIVQGNSGWVVRSPKIERSPENMPKEEKLKRPTIITAKVTERKHEPKTISIPVTVTERKHEPKPKYIKVTYLNGDN